GAARFNLPAGIAVDSAGSLFVCDFANYTIRKLTRLGPDWVASTVAGSAGMPGTTDGTNSDARFGIFNGVASGPIGVTVDRLGNLFVADTWNFTIRKLTAVGTDWVVTTMAGVPGAPGYADGTGSDARFAYPRGV